MLAKKIVNKDENLKILSNESYKSYYVDAVTVFNRYKASDIIETTNFDATSWLINNGVNRRCIDFIFDQIKYEQQARSRNLPPFDDFIIAFKCFFIILLQDMALVNCVKKVKRIKNILIQSNFMEKETFLSEFSKIKKIKSNIEVFQHIINFLDFAELHINPLINDLMESSINTHYSTENRRKKEKHIPEFLSITKFEEIISDFEKNASEKELDKYYPVIVWWRVTAIIPLRPTEFTLIPYDCIWEENGKYYITVRRTKLKGKKEGIKHNIEDDYFYTIHNIDYDTYQLITNCRNRGDFYDYKYGYKRDFLLSYIQFRENINPSYWRDKSDYLNEIINLGRMEKMLNLFYKEIVISKYGMQIVQEEDMEDFTSNTIEKITLMDARHIAIINMVFDKVEASTIAELAGQTSVETAFGYYNHTSQIVKSSVIRTAYKLRKQRIDSTYDPNVINEDEATDYRLTFDRTIHQILSNRKGIYHSVRNGSCCSNQIEIEHCLIVDLKCFLCPYFIPDGKKTKYDLIKQYKENEAIVDESISAINLLLKAYTLGNPNKEKIELNCNRMRTALNQNLLIIQKSNDEEEDNV